MDTSHISSQGQIVQHSAAISDGLHKQNKEGRPVAFQSFYKIATDTSDTVQTDVAYEGMCDFSLFEKPER